MQLTQFTDYGLRVLMYLTQLNREHPVKITEIAEQFDLPRNHLIKVVNKMGKLGWIKATRGRNGGLRLAISPHQLSLKEILIEMENSHQLIDCEKSVCRLQNNCQLKNILDSGLNTFYQHMAQYTLADLVAPPTGTQIIKMHQAYSI